MTDVENCEILTIVEKFIISPHDRCKKLKSTLFCCQISWLAVYAVLPWNLFCRDLRAFCVEKNCSQKCAMWRKNDKYDVCKKAHDNHHSNDDSSSLLLLSLSDETEDSGLIVGLVPNRTGLLSITLINESFVSVDDAEWSLLTPIDVSVDLRLMLVLLLGGGGTEDAGGGLVVLAVEGWLADTGAVDLVTMLLLQQERRSLFLTCWKWIAISSWRAW